MKGSGSIKWVIVAIVGVLAFSLCACSSGGGNAGKTNIYESRIVEITTLPVNGGQHYNVIISSDVDWSEEKTEERQGIAQYGVNKAIELAESENLSPGNYTILGTSEEGDILFQYNGETSIRIFVDGAPAEDISL